MDIADRMQCPPDFVAVPAVIALAAVIGRKVVIRPQERTDWYEVANLWGCIVGRPGALKSPAMAEAIKPLQRLEANARELGEGSKKQFTLETEAFKLFKEIAQKGAKTAIRAGERNVAGMLDVEAPVEPPERRYIVIDATYEALGEIMADNPNGVLAFRDEVVSLLKTVDREEYVAARAFYLTAWNGTSSYTFDRITIALQGRRRGGPRARSRTCSRCRAIRASAPCSGRSRAVS
jgi:hypothetical protein